MASPNHPTAPVSVPPKALPRPQVTGKGSVDAPVTGKSK